MSTGQAAHEIYSEGEKLKDEGKYEEAIAKFLESAAADESYAIAHFGLAVLFGRVGKHQDAVKHARIAVKLDPDDVTSYTALSVVYQRAYAGTNDMQYIQLAEEAMAKAHEIQHGPHGHGQHGHGHQH
ncbi:MAG: tetratricopeptide repeat protein [Pirellulaceae bacterium]|jgi:tetratricopeptide (TPR) repeat protein|nr:tetratricopeptide repeat protein [Pirellulaceae bacterium]MDP7015699.1 tetratricopeptide repeat protein [Pirellulaceae bacterium]